MALSPDPTWPTLPPKAGTYWQTAVTADVINNLTAAALHLAGVKFRPSTHNLVTYDTSGAADATISDPLLQIDPGAVSGTIHNPIRLSPFATALALRVGYQAAASPSGTPIITASLEIKDGAELDAGIEWTGDTLPHSVVRVPWVLGSSISTYPIQYVTTGLTRGTSTYPRPLTVGAGADEWCDVLVTSAYCRIVSVDVIEIPDSTVAT